MTLQEQCTLSYYKEIAVLDSDHRIILVQHQESRKIFVRKTLTVFDAGVYEYLKSRPVQNTPRIFECIRDGDTLIVIEEYIFGSTIKELLAQRGVFSTEQTADTVLKLCPILRDLHRASPPIIHRDIKPSNIIIAPGGRVILLDMNAAKHKKTGASSDTKLMGTAGYAAPEQYGFGTSDARTDIYAVGVLMNEMLTGALPGERVYSGPLSGIIEKCTRMDPSKRYQNMDELIDAFGKASGLTSKTQSRRRFLPPGFRSAKPLHMILSALGYIFIILISNEISSDYTGPDRVLNFVFIFAALIAMVLLPADYLGIKRRFPLTRSRHKAVRIFGIIVWDCLFFISAVILIVMLENLFGFI